MLRHKWWHKLCKSSWLYFKLHRLKSRMLAEWEVTLVNVQQSWVIAPKNFPISNLHLRLLQLLLLCSPGSIRVFPKQCGFISGTWALDELSGVLGVPQELLRRKLALWQQHGVLQEESPGRYSVLEKASSRERPDRSIILIDSDEEGDSNTTTQSEQREEKLQVGGALTYLQALNCHYTTAALVVQNCRKSSLFIKIALTAVLVIVQNRFICINALVLIHYV